MANEYVELAKQVAIAFAALAISGGLAGLGLLLRGPITKLIEAFKTETAAQTQDVKSIVESACGPISSDIRSVRRDMSTLAENLLNSSNDHKRVVDEQNGKITTLMVIQREHGTSIAKLQSEVSVLVAAGGMRDTDKEKIEGLHDASRS